MTTNSAAVRWGDGRRADSDFAREQILEAAWRCYKQNTIYKTSMEHIAREAKVSRTTIYRYFQNRDEVLGGVIVGALDVLTKDIGEQTKHITSFAEFLAEALSRAADQAPVSPVFSVLLKEEHATTSRIYLGSSDLLAIVINFMQGRFEQAQKAGELRDGIEFTQFIDWIVHVMLAYVVAPSPLRGSDSSGLKMMLWHYLIPAIVREEAIPAIKL